MNLFGHFSLYVERHGTDVCCIARDSRGRQASDSLEQKPAPPVQATWTYSELATLTSQLQGRLEAAGLRRGHVAGVWMERSPTLLATLLACQALGVTFVPLDALWPAARLQKILKDSGAHVLLTDSDNPQVLHVPRLRVDREEAASSGIADAPAPSATQLAYVIYTSGSTGEPKGVAVSDDALAAFIVGFAQAMGFRSSDVFLAATTVTFDPFIVELFLPLTIGASMVLDSPSVYFDLARMRDVEARRLPTVMQTTPSVWRQLLQSGWQSRPGLKMLTGGEALNTALARDLCAGGGTLWNIYGPTETVVWATVAGVDPQRAPVLGKPIRGRRLYVVERGTDGLSRLPRGRGELAIGGDHLAEGYLAAPELTARQFVADPWGNAGDRIYLTGDLVDLDDGGELTYVGRADHQVKIRGHRIEPVEVEHALAAAFPQGQCCVVVVAEGDGKELAAFLALRDPAIDTAVVRRALEGVLMAAMVPRHIHFVDRFELDNNGKVDRARLRALHASVAISVATSPEPQHHDDALATIWSQALKLATVDEGTHFFDAGGDSFKALRCIAKINSRFGTELDIAMLYQAPTLGLMRANVGASVGALHDPIAVLGQPLAAAQNLVPSLVLVHALDGDFAPYGELTLSLMSSHRILALTQTRLQSSEQHAALDGLAREYASALCERYGLTAGATVVGWSFGGVLAYALCEQLQLLGMPPARLVMLDSDFADGQALSDAVELPAAASATLMRSAHWRGNMDRWQGYRPSTPLDFAVDYVEATASIDEPGRRRATMATLRTLCKRLATFSVASDHLKMLKRPDNQLIVDLLLAPRKST